MHGNLDLLTHLVETINKHYECLSQDDLMRESKIMAKTWKARGWTMESLYQAADRTYEAPELGSYFEDRVHSCLRDVCPGVEIEFDKKLTDMHGFKSGSLRADFYIEELRLIVEADGKQHLTGRGDPDMLDYIRANDRLKDEYAVANGLTLIRIPQTVDRRAIKTRLLRGIRRARPGFRPLNSSNAGNTSGSTRRVPIRREVSSRPKIKRGEKGEPLPDVYCRGCHASPSFKHKFTYYCEKCWHKAKELWLTSRAMQKNQVPEIKSKIEGYIKEKGRYVWQSEVYLYCCPFSADDLKKNGIVVAKICRKLGFFAPEDDRIGRETVQRVKDFVFQYRDLHNRLPKLTEVLKGVSIDHTTLWTYMDFDKFIEELGGRPVAEVRFRYPSSEDFLKAAAEIVRKAGRPMRMLEIAHACGICYPAYLEYFRDVRSEHIHDLAGLPRFQRRKG